MLYIWEYIEPWTLQPTEANENPSLSTDLLERNTSRANWLMGFILIILLKTDWKFKIQNSQINMETLDNSLIAQSYFMMLPMNVHHKYINTKYHRHVWQSEPIISKQYCVYLPNMFAVPAGSRLPAFSSHNEKKHI